MLWRRGPATVRDVLGQMEGESPVGYTTILRLLQNMHEKGLVSRDESARSHIYAAAVEEEATEARLLREFTRRAFSGSTSRLVLRALGARGASRAELAEVRALLDRLETRD